LKLLSIAALLSGIAIAQEEDFQVFGDAPRLLLSPKRLRLLQRERERTSIRWMQFETLVAGRAAMDEPGFAWGLYYKVSGTESFGKQSIAWALAPGSKDLRQLALVYDWCQPLLTDSQSKALTAKIQQGIAASKGDDFPTVRNRVLALIALGGPQSKSGLELIVKDWWRKRTAPALSSSGLRYPREQSYALFEMLHAIRDNLNIDLRDEAPKYFRELPAYQILSYYPAAFPAAENEYRIPFYSGNGEPDLRIAALSRAADLAMVSYDTNAQENQFVQGWLIHDRFLMRGVFGIVYEFLWANPYQPGLSYYFLPLAIHQSTAGRLVLRSNWEDTASWFHFEDGKVQVFEDGLRKDRNMQSPAPIEIGGTLVEFGRSPMKFVIDEEEAGLTFVVGLKPATRYDIEVDSEELAEHTTDAGGILALKLRGKKGLGVRLRESPVARQ
jgi:hypothetical protein